jgi:glycosyltransferase involved in cell wall biosynthesis
LQVPVAVILPTEEIGGHETLLMRWLSSAREYGLEPTIYCRSKREVTDLVEKSGLTWVPVDFVDHQSGILRGARWKNFVRTWRTAAQAPRGAAVLLAPGAMQLANLQILACRLSGRPIACYVPMTQDAATLGMGRPGLRDRLTAIFASWVRLWVTSSDAQGRRLLSWWRVRVPILMVPTRLTILTQPPRDVKLDGGSRLRVVFLGRFSPFHKGLDWLADVLAAEPAWMEHYTFIFQGRGAFLDRLQELARQLGPTRMQISPWGDPVETFATADTLILTSRYEGFPLIAVEAVWSGVPVIASDESGLEDVLPPACLFPFGNVERFRAALERMRDPQNRRDAVLHARQQMTIQLSDERFRASLGQVTQELDKLRH